MPASGKVTVMMAQAIRADVAGGATYTSLQAKYGVHRATLSRVARGITAAGAPGPLTQTKVRWKLRCVNGHLLAENRSKSPKNPNCLTCHRERTRENRRRQREANDTLVIQDAGGT